MCQALARKDGMNDAYVYNGWVKHGQWKWQLEDLADTDGRYKLEEITSTYVKITIILLQGFRQWTLEAS